MAVCKNLMCFLKKIFVKMRTNSRDYVIKTVIPEYLLPLPTVEFQVYRKYRKNYFSPKSLLELCCAELEKIAWNGVSSIKWREFEEIFQLSPKIVTDSYRILGHIKNRNLATQYVVNRAKSKKMSICGFLRHVQVIRAELSSEIARNRLENHWDRMAGKPKFPYILIGQNNQNIKVQKAVGSKNT